MGTYTILAALFSKLFAAIKNYILLFIKYLLILAVGDVLADGETIFPTLHLRE